MNDEEAMARGSQAFGDTYSARKVSGNVVSAIVNDDHVIPESNFSPSSWRKIVNYQERRRTTVWVRRVSDMSDIATHLHKDTVRILQTVGASKILHHLQNVRTGWLWRWDSVPHPPTPINRPHS